MGKIHTDSFLFTRNPKWGVVLRMDFHIDAESNPPLIDRLVCWRQKGGQISTMFAIGQDVPPLVKANKT